MRALKRSAVVVLATGIAGLASATASPTVNAKEAVDAAIIHSGDGANIGAKHGFRVLTTADDYAAALAEMNSPDEPLDVDFGSSLVLFADMGIRSSGGYTIGLASAVSDAGVTGVTLDLGFPASDCGVTAALTEPYLFVLLPSTDPVLVREQRVVNDC